MAEIYPSLLALNEQEIDKTVKLLEPLVPGFHLDIMDNIFVPNTGISIEKTNAIAQMTYRQLWVHLMVQEPELYLNKLQLPPDSIVTFHLESNKDFTRIINNIIEKKWLPGIAIKPKTGINEVFPFLDQLYQVLIMSVEPGFSGQPFLEETVNKIEPLVGYRETNRLNFKIAIDGGINFKNFKELSQKGADQLAIGSALFEAKAGLVKAYQLFSELAE